MEHDNKTIDPEGFLLVDDFWSNSDINQSDFTGKAKWKSGNKRWYKDGMIHREDGPAIVHADGTKKMVQEQ